MVKYGIEDWKTFDSPGSVPPVHLVIYTNEITKEILESIDTEKTPNIIFEIPKKNGAFDLQVELYVWMWFARNIQSLSFRGTLVEKQFTVKHFEIMTRLEYLSIGATSYPLFEGEDISKLPVIYKFYCGGYGIVKSSESLKLWERKIKLNAEATPNIPQYYIH